MKAQTFARYIFHPLLTTATLLATASVFAQAERAVIIPKEGTQLNPGAQTSEAQQRMPNPIITILKDQRGQTIQHSSLPPDTRAYIERVQQAANQPGKAAGCCSVEITIKIHVGK